MAGDPGGDLRAPRLPGWLAGQRAGDGRAHARCAAGLVGAAAGRRARPRRDRGVASTAAGDRRPGPRGSGTSQCVRGARSRPGREGRWQDDDPDVGGPIDDQRCNHHVAGQRRGPCRDRDAGLQSAPAAARPGRQHVVLDRSRRRRRSRAARAAARGLPAEPFSVPDARGGWRAVGRLPTRVDRAEPALTPAVPGHGAPRDARPRGGARGRRKLPALGPDRLRLRLCPRPGYRQPSGGSRDAGLGACPGLHPCGARGLVPGVATVLGSSTLSR